MKRFALGAAAACLVALPVLAHAQAAASGSPLIDSAKAQFTMTKSYIVKAAEKMPEDQYSFKPTPEVRSFGGLVAHVANANYMICSRAAGEESPSKEDIEKTKTAKADLVKALNDSFGYCEGVFGKMTDATSVEKTKFFGNESPRLGILWFNTVHNYEHYGNMVTYMRMKNLVPPSSERGM